MPQTITETSTKTEKFTETVTSYITSATGGTSAPAACDKIGEENADNIAYFNNVEDVNTCSKSECDRDCRSSLTHW